MTTLHLIRSSAFTNNNVTQALKLLNNDDRVFLLDDGAYNLNHPLFQNLSQKVFVQEQHCMARGLACPASFILASMKDLITETEHARQVITWQ